MAPPSAHQSAATRAGDRPASRTRRPTYLSEMRRVPPAKEAIRSGQTKAAGELSRDPPPAKASVLPSPAAAAQIRRLDLRQRPAAPPAPAAQRPSASGTSRLARSTA